MSAAHPTHFVPSAFTLKIGSVSPARHIPSALKCPPHVKIAFDARWHSLDGGTAAAWTPWVGNVDVERFYSHQRRTETLDWAKEQCGSAVQDDAEGEEDAGPDIDAYYERILKGWIPSLEDISLAPSSDQALLQKMRIAPRPGYELGVCGKIQLFIMQTVDTPTTTSNSTKGTEQTTPVKVFLVDYDLASLVSGGRLLYKERAYQTIEEAPRLPGSPATTTASPGAKPRAREVLKYAFELHFLCTEKPKKPCRAQKETPPGTTNPRKRRHETASSTNTHRHRSYYLGKQIRLVFPTSSSSFNNTDGAAIAQRQSSLPPVRVERLIEVQNPVPPDFDNARSEEVDSSSQLDQDSTNPPHGPVKLSESLTSESWEGLHARWTMRNQSGSLPKREIRRRASTKDPSRVDDSDRSSGTTDDSRLEHRGQPYGPVISTTSATVADRDAAILFTRSPTPVQPALLKSPSLLTTRLEEMSSLSPQTGPSLPLGADKDSKAEQYPPGQAQRIASPGGGRRRTLWPDDDTERLLSESFQKLPVSYR